jgi:hypothetical protein
MSQCLLILAAGARLWSWSPNLRAGRNPRSHLHTCHTATQTGSLRKAGEQVPARVRVTWGKVTDGELWRAVALLPARECLPPSASSISSVRLSDAQGQHERSPSRL